MTIPFVSLACNRVILADRHRSTLSTIKLFVQRFGSIYLRKQDIDGISVQINYTLVPRVPQSIDNA